MQKFSTYHNVTKVAWQPNPGPQTQVLTISPLDAFEILYGGARGGGKTDAGMAWLLYDHEHPLYRALVVRKNAEDLRDWIDRAGRFFAPVHGAVVGNPPEIRFPEGGVIRTGHLKDDKAYQKYQGHEYHRMLIEELTHISSELNYLKLIASCRSTVPELRPQVFGTTNPDGPGFEWVKRRWQLHGIPTQLLFLKDAETGRMRVFVPARVRDNPYLVNNDPGYLAFLNGLPDGLREAWKDGSWDEPNIKGAYYTLALLQARRDGCIKLVPYDASLKVHTVWDLGIGEQLVCGFFQRISTETRLIDTWQGEGADGMLQAATMLQRKPYIYGKHYAPHDAKKTETGTGLTIIQTAKKVGVAFEPVPSIGVSDGITKTLMMFPRLYISEPTCEQFLSAIRQYRKDWDENRLDWKDEPFKDWTNHYADMLRYAALVEDKMTNETVKPYRPIPNTPVTEFETGLDPIHLPRRYAAHRPDDDPVSEYEGGGQKPWSFDDSMNL